jgi:hypothetical protein
MAAVVSGWRSDPFENRQWPEFFVDIFNQSEESEDIEVTTAGTSFDFNATSWVLTLSIALGKLKTSSPSFRSSGSRLTGTTRVSSPSDDAMR